MSWIYFSSRLICPRMLLSALFLQSAWLAIVGHPDHITEEFFNDYPRLQTASSKINYFCVRHRAISALAKTHQICHTHCENGCALLVLFFVNVTNWFMHLRQWKGPETAKRNNIACAIIDNKLYFTLCYVRLGTTRITLTKWPSG